MKSLKDLVNITQTETVDNYDELKVKWYNESEGNLNKVDGIECSLCRNKGFIEYLDENKRGVVKNCECQIKRIALRRALNSGLGDYINKTFKDYIDTEQWQLEIKKKASEYCKCTNNEWFIMLGQSGCGKTLIASIICNWLLRNKNKDVLYITWTDFISKLKRDMMNDNSNEVSKYLDAVKNVELLFLDEMLKKYNDTDLKYIIEILNYRYTNNLQTIITSERSLDNLLEIDESIAGRMVEKAHSYLLEIKKDRNKNQRLKNVTTL